VPSRLRARLLAAALALPVAAGCKYSFDNQAERLLAGQVIGRATADGAALGGAAVSLRGSALDQATRQSGRFDLHPVSRGSHAVLLRQGLARAQLRQVDVGYGSDGQLEGVALGDLPLPRAVTLSGGLLSLGSASLSGLLLDQETGLYAVTSGGAFRLEGLPVGPHRLLAATRDPATGDQWVAAPVVVTVTEAEQGTEKVVVPLSVRSATSAVGQLHFRVASLVSGLEAAAAVVRVTDAGGGAVAVPSPDSNGDRDLPLPEGLYFVEVTPPPAFASAVTAPRRAPAVVLGGDELDLGSFVLISDADLAAAQLSCERDADCAPGGTCSGGLCAGYAPPAVAPAGVPICSAFPWCPTIGDACDLPGSIAPASCLLDPTTSYGVCVPCSSACTPDGTALLSALACP
jgi:hypothetical protein